MGKPEVLPAMRERVLARFPGLPPLALSAGPHFASPLLGRLQRAWTGRPWTLGAAPVYAWPHSLDPRADAAYRPVVNPSRSLPAARVGLLQPSPAATAGAAQIAAPPVLQAGLSHVLQRSQLPLAAQLAASGEALPRRRAASNPPAAAEHQAARSMDSELPIVAARRVSAGPAPHLPPALSEPPETSQASPDIAPAPPAVESSNAKEPAPPVKLGRVIQRRHLGAGAAPAGRPTGVVPEVPIDPAQAHPIHRYPDSAAGHLPASGGQPPEPAEKAGGPVAGHLPESIAHVSRPSAAPMEGSLPVRHELLTVRPIQRHSGQGSYTTGSIAAPAPGVPPPHTAGAGRTAEQAPAKSGDPDPVIHAVRQSSEPLVMPDAAPREGAQDLPIHRAVHLQEPPAGAAASGAPPSGVPIGDQSTTSEIPIPRAVHREEPPAGAAASGAPPSGVPIGGQPASSETPIHRAVPREEPPADASASGTPTGRALAGGQSAAAEIPIYRAVHHPHAPAEATSLQGDLFHVVAHPLNAPAGTTTIHGDPIHRAVHPSQSPADTTTIHGAPTPLVVQPSHSPADATAVQSAPSHLVVQPAHSPADATAIQSDPSHLVVQPAHAAPDTTAVHSDPSHLVVQPAHLPGSDPTAVHREPSDHVLHPSNLPADITDVAGDPSRHIVRPSHSETTATIVHRDSSKGTHSYTDLVVHHVNPATPEATAIHRDPSDRVAHPSQATSPDTTVVHSDPPDRAHLPIDRVARFSHPPAPDATVTHGPPEAPAAHASHPPGPDVLAVAEGAPLGVIHPEAHTPAADPALVHRAASDRTQIHTGNNLAQLSASGAAESDTGPGMPIVAAPSAGAEAFAQSPIHRLVQPHGPGTQTPPVNAAQTSLPYIAAVPPGTQGPPDGNAPPGDSRAPSDTPGPGASQVLQNPDTPVVAVPPVSPAPFAETRVHLSPAIESATAGQAPGGSTSPDESGVSRLLIPAVEATQQPAVVRPIHRQTMGAPRIASAGTVLPLTAPHPLANVNPSQPPVASGAAASAAIDRSPILPRAAPPQSQEQPVPPPGVAPILHRAPVGSGSGIETPAQVFPQPRMARLTQPILLRRALSGPPVAPGSSSPPAPSEMLRTAAPPPSGSAAIAATQGPVQRRLHSAGSPESESTVPPSAEVSVPLPGQVLPPSLLHRDPSDSTPASALLPPRPGAPQPVTSSSPAIARLTIHAPRPFFSAPAAVQAQLDRAPFTGAPSPDMILRMPVELQDAVSQAEPAAHLQHLHRFPDHPAMNSSPSPQNSPSAAAAVTPTAPPSNASGAKGVDIAQLADHVYRILVRKLNSERDRRGY